MTDDIRTFDTGATRDTEDGKPDYEGFLSPLVLKRYAEYMNEHRVQADGKIRASDNWQKGIPLNAYMKSMWRHFMDLWVGHRRCDNRFDIGIDDDELEASLCAVIFNASGYLHEMITAQHSFLAAESKKEKEPENVASADACMPAPTKESLAALGTAEATLAVDGAKDPGHVLTPEGWALIAKATPASNPVGFKADDYVHAASVETIPASDRADLKPMVPDQAKEFRRMKPSRKTALNVEATSAGDPDRRAT